LTSLPVVASITAVDRTGSGRAHIKRGEAVMGLDGSVSFGVGSRVMLVKNEGKQGVAWGLFNGALGECVGFGYSPGSRPPALPCVVYVRFPEYTGPIWHETHPHVLPIAVRSGFCDGKCCERRMIPLVCAAACTIHKLQGLTVGMDKPVKKLIIQPGSVAMEKSCAGLLFVAASRGQKKSDIAFDLPVVVMERLACVRFCASFAKRSIENERLVRLAQRTASCLTIPAYDEIVRQVIAYLGRPACLRSRHEQVSTVLALLPALPPPCAPAQGQLRPDALSDVILSLAHPPAAGPPRGPAVPAVLAPPSRAMVRLRADAARCLRELTQARSPSTI